MSDRRIDRHIDRRVDDRIDRRIDRRRFLQGAGALVISFSLAPIAATLQPAATGAPRGGARAASDGELDAWLAIDTAGLVTLFSGKVELGTGVETALSQIVAEELDVPVAQVRVVQGDTDRSPNQGLTVGSKTLQVGGVQVRRAAAEARRALLELASQRLSAPIADLAVTDGIVHLASDAPAASTPSGADAAHGRRAAAAGDREAAAARSVAPAAAAPAAAAAISQPSSVAASPSAPASPAVLAAPADGAGAGVAPSATTATAAAAAAAARDAASTGEARRVSYGALLDGRPFARPVSEGAAAAVPKRPADYRIVGQPVPRVELPAKVAGAHEYVHNIRLPGMLHGRVVRPSAIGATLASIDESSIRSLPGIVALVRKGDFIGIVAEREEQAIAAARALRVTWTPPATPLPDVQTLEAIIRATPVTERVLASSGQPSDALAAAAVQRAATYVMPFQSHASTGPSCGVADVREGEATIWSGTQGCFALRDSIAGLLELPPARVRVIWTEASGCYGHNGADDAAADAAVLSRETRRPVRVQWMRHDEHAWDPKGPAMLMEVRGGLDAGGTIVAWDYAVTTPTHSTRPVGRAANLLAAQLMGQRGENGTIGGDRNARHKYRVAHERSRVRWMQQSVLRPSSFRGLGAPANVFAIESFIDELATAARIDPIALRLRHLDDPRAQEVVRRAATLARWQPRVVATADAAAASAPAATSTSASAPAPAQAQAGSLAAGSMRPRGASVPPDLAEGRGAAFLQYENQNTYVALIVDVTVSRSTGAVRVTRVFVAHDCGLIVNPDGLRNQIEGNVLQGISRTLKEEVRWDAAAVTTVDWQSYPILTFADVPDSCEIALIDRPDQPSLGAGEAAHCAVPAAIANAIADATGARLRTLPFTPDRVKTALAAISPAGR